jgi:putative ABC transport system permease protein
MPIGVWLRVCRDRIRALVGRERVVEEIGDELRHHEDLLAARFEREGQSPEDARREARRRVGNLVTLTDAGYDVRGGGLLEALVRDIRYALRVLRRSPAFTLTAIGTLAIGIGANTAIFSVASGVLLRPLPYPAADRLAMVWMDNTRLKLREDWHSFPDFLDYRDRNTTFESLAIFNITSRTFTGDGDPERVIGAHGSASLFDVLGVKPAMGRPFGPADDQAGARNVVVLADGLWRRRFGADRTMLGRTIQMSGRPTEVIGVMPPGFAFPTREVQFWVPTAASEAQRTNRGSLWLQMIGRLARTAEVPQAQADLGRINVQMVEQFPQRKGYGVYVASYREQLVGQIRPAILVLLGAVGFVLLIACTNVANLLLSRATTRERELALRAAIGAGRGRLVRQLLTESVVLGLSGGVVGAGLAWLGLRALLAAAPRDLPRMDAIAIDGWVLAFTLGLSLLTGLIFGLAPSIQLARTDPGHALKEGGRGSSGLGRSMRRGLVVLEVALAVVLLVGAGLMLRSFDRLRHVDLGFQADHLLTARLTLWGERYRQPDAVAGFFRDLIDRIEAQPGVVRAAGIGTVFLSATPNSTNFSIEGRPDFPPDERVEVPVDGVTPHYFEVMGIPLVRGRVFDARDVASGTQVVVINETMARMFWPDQDPIGRRIKYGQLNSQGPWMTIVGIVKDTRRTGFDAAVRPETYLPHAQSLDSSLMLVIRTAGKPEDLIPSLRATARAIDPAIAVQATRPLEDVIVEMTAERRLNTMLLSVFGVSAALLAAVGIYGVIAYSVEQRTRELGVRLALGATAAGIVRLVVAEGVSLAVVGLGLGLGAALLLSGSMTSLLYGVPATDPATFAVMAGVALVTAGAASLLPALRAIRIDPVSALRADG